jgi:ribonucleotide reductase class II
LTSAQEFIYTRTYSRWLPEQNRREKWPETVKRYLDFMAEEVDGITVKHVQTAQSAIENMDVMPSMRALWAAGPAARNNNITLYNCSYLAVNDIRAFSECLFILMCGTGVGFSVERKYVDHLPSIMPRTGETRQVVVEDSKEGWANSLLQVMMYLWAGYDVTVDYSKVRPRGSRLLTMGGRASGPEPLMNLFNFLIRKFEEKRSKKVLKLDSLDCLDIMNMIADIVVVGGVRRSSEISLSDLSDRAIAEAKMGEFWNQAPWRSMSNNSAVYEGKPDPATFLQEWTTLVKSGSGERGIFNRYGAAKQMVNSGRREPWDDIGTNPCFAAGTLIHTKEGHFPIESLVGKTVEVWDGKEWVTCSNFRVTAENQPLLRIVMQDGSQELVTPYHTMCLEGGTRVKARDLQVGEKLELSTANQTHGRALSDGAYLKGFLVGDGSATKEGGQPLLWLYRPKWVCADRLIESALEIEVGEVNTNAKTAVGFVPSTEERLRMGGLAPLKEELLPWCDEYKKHLPAEIFSWTLADKTSFIAGVMDADGTASDTSNGFMYQLSSVNHQWLLDFQNLLKTIGVNSKVALTKPEGTVDLNDGYGSYETQPLYRLTISQRASVRLATVVTFSRLTSFKDKKLSYNVKTKRNIVMAIEPAGVADKVYCCTIPSTHSLALTSGIQYGQCGEIILRDQEFCNLSEVVVRPNDTLDVLKKKVKLATMFGCWQASFTNFPFLRKDWQANCNEERLLGVSLTGIMDHPVLNHVNDRMKKWLAEMKSVAVAECEKWCARLNMNMSAAITCVKPSGTVSQLVNCASGIHPRYAQYYIRRYRISATDPLFRLMRDAGVVAKPEVGQTSETAATMVLEFPFASPDNAKTRHDYSAIDQLEHWKVVKDFWCEHNPSITVYVDESEWVKTAAWVHDNFDDVCGVSFLPKDNGVYQLAPYEEINKNTWKSLVTQFPEVNYGLLSEYEQEDNTQGSQSYACLGDKCEL